MAIDGNAYRQSIAELAEQSLRPYIDRVSTQPDHLWPTRKEVNDPIWGSLNLSAHEVVVLDSPLLQRLRSVRQLGVVHLVYPSAGHSRLEHSIGATHLVGRLIDAMNDAADKPIISDHHRRLLRLAALCHDIGHGLMSHVSENALKDYDEVVDLLNSFRTIYGDDVSLSELNAAFLIRSPAFTELLDIAVRVGKTTLGVGRPADWLADAVLAKSVETEFPTLQELISGPFDADKLDYMTRDAVLTGVPVVTDVNRLIQKARARLTPTDRLPERMASRIHDQDMVTVTGIAVSGNRTLDELTFGRALLFDKIYRHHKVRAAERMVSGIIRQLATSVPLPELIGLLLRGSDDLILSAGLFDDEAVGDSQRAIGTILMQRLRDRDLLVRCAAFSRKMPGDGYEGDPEHVAGLTELLKQLGDPFKAEEVGQKIAREARQLIEIVGDQALLGAFPDQCLEPFVYVDPPRAAPNLPTSKALLIGSNEVVAYDVEAPETRDWANSYHQTRDLGYVFGPREVAEHIAVATQRVLRTEFNIRLSPTMLCFGSRTEASLLNLRERALTSGFLAGAPVDLLPLPARLRAGDVPRKLERFAANTSAFSSPLTDRTAADDAGLRPQRTMDWLAQFRSDDLIDAALRVLDRVQLVGRQQIVQSVRSFIRTNNQFADAVVVRLGEAKDSSSIATYYALDVEEFESIKAMDIAEAILSGRPLLLVDDITHSGRQAASIIDAWFGDLESSQALGEDRRPLPEALQHELQKRQLGLVFAAGTSAAQQRLQQTAERWKLNLTVAIKLMDDAMPSLADVDFASPEQREHFTAVAREVGLALLHDKPNKEERALGYGNGGLLLVFPYNVPTQTLTCLWRGGRYNGAAWQPLFPRRRKR